MIDLHDPTTDTDGHLLEALLFFLALAITGMLSGLALGAWLSSDWLARLIAP